MVNKSELVENIAKKTGLSLKDANASVSAFMGIIKESLGNGDPVVLVGFGSFVVRDRAARTGHNPRTGETLNIPAVKVPAFRPGKSLKDAVNK
ncbi:MAG TPA: HU family DNA-binding protein [Candidatus Anaerobiospirillum stercoravium]|nr:HU family DNA-binding protein [Candidatus Anaerobiospirillum stercoravium]